MRTVISHADVTRLIAPLRCARAASGYRGVYYHKKNKDGVPVYVARFKRAGTLRLVRGSRSTDPRLAALALAEHYRAVFGDGWADALRGRKRPPFTVWRSKRYGGWLARAWVRGRPVGLVPLTRGRPPCSPRTPWTRRTRPPESPRPMRGRNPLVFRTAAEAAAAVRPWVLRQYGTLAVLWRTGSPGA
ncbi:MAG: hypothetical protein E6Q76_19650 [Rhizobium sp.]|nr:MAG: hypothetical protein E6Q76_19650 [Rhizobium sp.]